jgi:hypothetical protein
MASPTLLTLPREIRNNVYSRLSKELQFDWLWAINKVYIPPGFFDEAYGLASIPALYDVVEVLFHNAPDPAVPAAHSRLRAEYLEEQELPHEGLSVCITLKLRTVHLNESGTNEQHTDAYVKSAFAKVKHVALNVDFPSYGLDHNPSKLPDFLGFLLPKLTNLKTLRITLRQSSASRLILDMDLLQELLPLGLAERAVEFLPVLPNVLAGLHAVQRGEGYHVGYAKSKHAETHGFAAGQMNARWNPKNLEFITWHHADGKLMGYHLVAILILSFDSIWASKPSSMGFSSSSE